MFSNIHDGDFSENIKNIAQDKLSNFWTALPCSVVSFDPVDMTIAAQPLIKANWYNSQGVLEQKKLPVLLDVPVVFPMGGNCVITFPIKAGDECLVVFSSRCIDGWWYYGGIQEQPIQAQNDLSDGIAIVGLKSLPNVVPNISTNSVQIRNITGSSVISLKEDGEININSTNIIKFNGDVEFTGTIKSNGKIIDNTHTHTGVQPGSGSTGVVS